MTTLTTKKETSTLGLKLGIYIDVGGSVKEVFQNTPNISFTKKDTYTQINLLEPRGDEIEIVQEYVFYRQ